MKFGEIFAANRPHLVVSPRHEAWLPRNGNPVYSTEALEFGARELLKQATPRDRRGTVSASSLGSCARKQLFTFIGVPEAPINPRTAQIFQNGTFMHIRWQMAGITEGWLKHAEVPIPKDNAFGLSGTQDGIAWDDSVVEFKSINTRGYTNVTAFGPKHEHLFQIGTYLAATGAARATLIYEDKNTQEYQEHVVSRETAPLAEVAQRADLVWSHAEHKTLPEPLPKCIDREGMVYNYCPFKNSCLKIRSWEHAKEIA